MENRQKRRKFPGSLSPTFLLSFSQFFFFLLHDSLFHLFKFSSVINDKYEFLFLERAFLLHFYYISAHILVPREILIYNVEFKNANVSLIPGIRRPINQQQTEICAEIVGVWCAQATGKYSSRFESHEKKRRNKIKSKMSLKLLQWK